MSKPAFTYEQNINIAEVGAIHKRSPLYKARKEKALAVIRAAFTAHERVCVSNSGGKDSVALLALVDVVAREQGRDYTIWAHVSDASFPYTVETIQASAARVRREVEIDASPVSAFDVIGRQSGQRFGKTGYFFESVKRLNARHDLVFTGVRAAESRRRNKAFTVHGHTFKTTVPSPITRCDAIAHFKIEDVAAAIVEHNMPIHPIYTKVALSPLPVRLGYATSMDLIEKGTVVFLKRNYPELFNKLSQALPGIRNYL